MAAAGSATRLGSCLAMGLVALSALTATAAADTYEVTTTADHAPGKCTKGDCTLREATIRANARDGKDKILVPASGHPYRLTRAGEDEDAGKKGDLDLGDDLLKIRGKGVGRTVIEQAEHDRVFHIAETTGANDVELSRMTVKGGNAGNVAGGGIVTEGDLFVGDARVVDNRAGVGGGIAAVGDEARLNLVNSTVSDNRAAQRGGGVYLAGTDGVANGVSRSTVAGNRAPQGGGIYFLPGAANVHVTAATITENQSLGSPTANGGGLFTESLMAGAGIAKLGSVTIASNEAPPGAGANIHPEIAAQLENTLIGPDLGGGDSCDLDVDSAGHNLDQGTTCGLDQGTDLEDAEGELKPLDDNGGPTETRALKASSDALGEGFCPGTILQLGVDQRGEGRPNACDIGAFERDPLP